MLRTHAVIVVAEMIREAQTTAREALCVLVGEGSLTLQELDSCIRALVRAELITEQADLIRWCGPAAGDPGSDLLLGQGRH